jgi:murein DD-endopeptidase MepM/ murein hydrolase activator NlpD
MRIGQSCFLELMNFNFQPIQKTARTLFRSKSNSVSLGFVLLLLGGVYQPILAQGAEASATGAKQSTCPEPALSRLVRHRVAAGETIESIAQQYNLLPTTLMGMNPVLQRGAAPVGTEIVVPPFNGIRVSVPAGSSWRDIAKQYGVRADVLFEANGCETAPSVVFVPGANWSPVVAPTNPAANSSSPINRYPLPEEASVVLAYGWQVNPRTNAVEFHSGVNLATPTETPVLAVGAGTVAFAGEQRGYGRIVVINHAQGLQTRYAQLQTVSVSVGQQVESGTSIGTVGAVNLPEAYLHFEVRSNSRLGWVAQDPGAYIQQLRIGDPYRR